MVRVKHWSVAMFAVLSAGCGGAWVEYTRVLPAPWQLQPHGPAQVQMMLVTPPVRPHVDIGMLRVHWSPYDNDTLEVHMYLLRTTAGQRGCDAVVVTRVVNVPAANGSIEGSCEVFTDVPAATRSRPPAPEAAATPARSATAGEWP